MTALRPLDREPLLTVLGIVGRGTAGGYRVSAPDCGRIAKVLTAARDLVDAEHALDAAAAAPGMVKPLDAHIAACSARLADLHDAVAAAREGGVL